MKRESHIILGNYLMENLPVAPAYRYQKAFLFGCIQPDSNPFTYLKGSRSIQWLRGHNYRNAEGLMSRMSSGLSRRDDWRLLDYYRLGKLIHYTSDAFTFAHNETFAENIHQHRCYEAKLQRCFKTSLYMLRRQAELDELEETVMSAIRETHDLYMEAVRSVRTDVEYILRMTEQVFQSLMPQTATSS